jgi:hypothetical protein
MSKLNQKPGVSDYKATFDFDDNHKKELNEKKWDHHFIMDKEKHYVECMLRLTAHERNKDPK